MLFILASLMTFSFAQESQTIERFSQWSLETVHETEIPFADREIFNDFSIQCKVLDVKMYSVLKLETDFSYVHLTTMRMSRDEAEECQFDSESEDVVIKFPKELFANEIQGMTLDGVFTASDFQSLLFLSQIPLCEFKNETLECSEKMNLRDLLNENLQ